MPYAHDLSNASCMNDRYCRATLLYCNGRYSSGFSLRDACTKDTFPGGRSMQRCSEIGAILEGETGILYDGRKKLAT